MVACANAGLLAPAPAPLAYAAAPILPAKQILTTRRIADAEYDPHPQYSYSYDVQDALTGDFKAQTESRNGDIVQGSYSLLEADGTRRTVDYTADPLNGFNAVVRKEPATLAIKAAVPAIPVTKTFLPAPAPVAVAAPVAKAIYPAAAAPAPYFAAAPALPASYYPAAPALLNYPAAPAVPIAKAYY